MKTLVSAFGRMNPPHIGHIALIDDVVSLSKKLNGTPKVFVSHSEGNKKNPLPYDMKYRLLNKWTDGVVVIDYDNEVKQPGNILHYAHKHSFDRVCLVCGDDRYEEYNKSFIGFANSRDYFNFDKVEVVRRSNYTNQITGTQMRNLVKDNDWLRFEINCPIQATKEEKEMIFKYIERTL